jgi:hypothetical protein
MNFDEKDLEAWKRASPQEGMRIAFEFLAKVAAGTMANKATEQKPKEALASHIEMLKWDLRTLDASALSDPAYKAIHDALMRAFDIGQFAGMIDERADGPAVYINAWRNQKKSTEAKRRKNEAWEAYALPLAKSICERRTKWISQASLAKKILAEEGWPECTTKPSKKKLIGAISKWEQAGELKRKKLSR